MNITLKKWHILFAVKPLVDENRMDRLKVFRKIWTAVEKAADAFYRPAIGLQVTDTDSKAMWLNLNGSTTTWGAIYAAQDTVATDADFTLPVYSSFVILPTISANRTVTLPVAASYENKSIIIKVANSAGFAWSVAVAIKDKSDGDVTALANDTVYTLYSDGTYWHITSIY